MFSNMTFNVKYYIWVKYAIKRIWWLSFLDSEDSFFLKGCSCTYLKLENFSCFSQDFPRHNRCFFHALFALEKKSEAQLTIGAVLAPSLRARRHQCSYGIDLFWVIVRDIHLECSKQFKWNRAGRFGQN